MIICFSSKLPKLRKYSRELFSADTIVKLIEVFFKLFRHYYNSVLDNNLFSIKFYFFTSEIDVSVRLKRKRKII